MASGEDVENAEKVVEATEEAKKISEERSLLEEKINELTKDRLRNLEEIKNENEINIRQNIDLLEKQREQLDQHRKILEEKIKNNEKDEETKSALNEILEQRREINANISRQNELLQENLQYQEAAKKAGQEAVELFSLSGRTFEQSIIGQVKTFSETLQAAPEAFTEAFNPKTLGLATLSGLFDKVVESSVFLTKEFDKLTAEFNAATGAAGRFNADIAAASKGSAALGVGLAEASAAAGALFMGFSGFNTINASTREELIDTTAALENVGVSAELTANSVDFLTKALGVSAEEAAATQVRLAEFAGSIGVAPSVMAENFKQSQPIMVQYGKVVGNQVFEQLTKQAKATGVAFGDLLSIAGQFDTFEGAANAAGKLNAILGGNLLNSVELLTAKEGDRVMMLRRAVIESGRNFTSLGKFEQRAIAAAAGIDDLTVAAKLFGGSSVEFERVTEEQASLAEMTAKAQSIQQKLNKAMEQFGFIMLPVVELVTSIITKFNKFADENKEVAGAILGITGVIGALVIALSALAPLAVTLSTFLPSLGKGAAIASPGVLKLGMAAGAGAKGLGMLGIAALLVGAGIGIAALGFAELADAFSKLNVEQMIGVSAAMLLIAGGIGAIVLAITNPIGAIAIPILIGLAATFAAMGFAIASAGEELNKFASIMAGMDTEKQVAFKAVIENFEDLVDKLADTPTANLEAAATVATSVRDAATAAAAAPTRTSNTAMAQPAQNGPVQVILQVDGTKLGEIMLNKLDTGMNMSLPVDTKLYSGGR
jgi:hypothetical protein